MQAVNPFPQEVIEIEDDSSDENVFLQQYVTLVAGEGDGEPFALNGVEQSDPAMFDNDQPAQAVDSSSLMTVLPVSIQACMPKVLEVFPDISHDHVRQIFDDKTQALAMSQVSTSNDEVAQYIIMQILDVGKYPKEKDGKKKLKRKRSEGEADSDDEAQWTAPDRPEFPWSNYLDQVRITLQQEFTNIPVKYIDWQLKERKFLYPTYLALELADRTYSEGQHPPYQRIKTARKPKCSQDNLELAGPREYRVRELEKELHAAKKKQMKNEAKRQQKKQAEEADAAVERECIEKGDMVEYQCCFTETPIPKATHCNGEQLHFFCLECARNNANAQIDLSRYKIACMDGSGCQAEFTRDQKHRFIDTKALELLERLQQQDDLRIAEVSNFEKCPFCDYGAICPPVDADREFRCRMPECERVSCRLCKRDSHLPLTCKEFKKEDGVAERHALEEAMTEALIRTCPKCKVPVLKEDGCNKVTCSRCRCIHCDVCGKDISKDAYAHFVDYGTRGGCQVHDDSNRRRREKVKAAEKETMAQLRAQNPGLSEEDLKIRFSEKISKSPKPNARYGNGELGLVDFYEGGMPPFHGVNGPNLANLIHENGNNNIDWPQRMQQRQMRQLQMMQQQMRQQTYQQRQQQTQQHLQQQMQQQMQQQNQQAAQAQIQVAQFRNQALQNQNNTFNARLFQSHFQPHLPPGQVLPPNGFEEYRRAPHPNPYPVLDDTGGPWPFSPTAPLRFVPEPNNIGDIFGGHNPAPQQPVDYASNLGPPDQQGWGGFGRRH